MQRSDLGHKVADATDCFVSDAPLTILKHVMTHVDVGSNVIRPFEWNDVYTFLSTQFDTHANVGPIRDYVDRRARLKPEIDRTQ